MGERERDRDRAEPERENCSDPVPYVNNCAHIIIMWQEECPC